MEKNKTVKLIDDNKEKSFIITKMAAFELFNLTNKILGLMEAANPTNLDVKAIKYYINRVMCTGLEIEGVSDEELAKVANQGWIPLVFNNAILISIDEDSRNAVLEPILKCIMVIGGGEALQLTSDNNSTCYVDNYIKDAINLYKLCVEVLKLNYLNFFLVPA